MTARRHGKLSLLCLVASSALAQTSPRELAQSVVQKWSEGPRTAFEALYPFQAGRNERQMSVSRRFPRVPGLAEAIRSNAHQATLLISGHPTYGNSGEDTFLGFEFSGLYEAAPDAGVWKLTRKIPLDDMGEIHSQDIRLQVRIGHGIDVEDRLRVRVKTQNGFAARLNHGASIAGVLASGKEARHSFGGGLLWIDLPPGDSTVTLRYSIEVETAPRDPNSGFFGADYGHVRNQYLWAPALGFESVHDAADFHIEARLPAAYRLTTSLPQTERVEGRERIVEGKSVVRTNTLTLGYDRDWQPHLETAGGVRLEMFITPSFPLTPEQLIAEFRKDDALFAARFGEPAGGYTAIVQLRGNPAHSFHSNQASFAAATYPLLPDRESATAILGHEIAHAWTEGSGPAAAFLREGWARYAESLVFEHDFGTAGADAFRKKRAEYYFKSLDGKAPMWNASSSWDLTYEKGLWVFHMLEEIAGPRKFNAAMALYSKRSLAGESTWETLADCFDRQNVPEFHAREFLLPWLKESSAPRLEAHAEGNKVRVTQQGPIYVLPLTVEAVVAGSPARRTLWMRDASTEIVFGGAVSSVKLDPDGQLLLKNAF